MRITRKIKGLTKQAECETKEERGDRSVRVRFLVIQHEKQLRERYYVDKVSAQDAVKETNR